jgi:hypothetical protein
MFQTCHELASKAYTENATSADGVQEVFTNMSQSLIGLIVVGFGYQCILLMCGIINGLVFVVEGLVYLWNVQPQVAYNSFIELLMHGLKGNHTVDEQTHTQTVHFFMFASVVFWMAVWFMWFMCRMVRVCCRRR